jgi:hypothetical protein
MDDLKHECLESVANFYCNLYYAPDNEDNSLKGSHRLLKLLRVLFARPDLSAENYYQIGSLMRSMFYQPPWDNEGVIGMYQRRILKIISDNFPDDVDLQKACGMSLEEQPSLKEEIMLAFPTEMEKYYASMYSIE